MRTSCCNPTTNVSTTSCNNPKRCVTQITPQPASLLRNFTRLALSRLAPQRGKCGIHCDMSVITRLPFQNS
eukprot:5208361-Prorocentrum_lima.AAC.1